jgi:hypothetical protein
LKVLKYCLEMSRSINVDMEQEVNVVKIKTNVL